MRLVIIDNHPLFREGMALLFGLEPDLTIAGDGATAEDAVRLVSTLKPDILLLDLTIPGGGLHALQQISELAPATRTVIFTASEDETAMLAAMKNGARGYVLRTTPTRQLVNIIREIHAGASHMSPELAMRVLINLANQQTEPTVNRLSILTAREYQILEMVSNGLSNRQIATTLNRTEAGIKSRMTMIMKKLQVNNRMQAAMLLNQAAY